ncbi:MAG: hypothetical protein ACXV7I_07530 [Ilumatobacteraceae bacterium]
MVDGVGVEVDGLFGEHHVGLFERAGLGGELVQGDLRACGGDADVVARHALDVDGPVGDDVDRCGVAAQDVCEARGFR